VITQKVSRRIRSRWGNGWPRAGLIERDAPFYDAEISRDAADGLMNFAKGYVWPRSRRRMARWEQPVSIGERI